MSGSAVVDMSYTVLRNNERFLKAKADLTEASISKNDLMFEKTRGEKAFANLSMEFDSTAELKSCVANLSGTGLSGAAQIDFSPPGKSIGAFN